VRDQAGQGEGQGALARARRSDDQEALAGSEVERDLVQGGGGSPRVPEPDGAGANLDRRSVGVDQVGNPSRTPVRRRARSSQSEPKATMTTAEIAIIRPRTSWTWSETPE